MRNGLIFTLILMFSQISMGADKITSLSGLDVLNSETKTFATAGHKATVIVFLSAKCPCSASHETLLKDLSQQYKEFQFIGIHSNSDETLEETQNHFREAKLLFPVIQDSRSQWANKLGALKTPHAFVLSPAGEMLYHGGVTDSHVGPTAKKQFLKEVLEDLQAEKPSRHKEGRALGCYIQRADEA
ncbi:thioredoxin-like domain-containing protein [Bdellovibrio bacteriovorus]|uniref:Serine protease spb1 n=1 Tax=Bdellovibrio bacteriovorus str. Tiberius TaxID=1069642 RepID=K7YYZ0_BDEBC|nr:thioredoxin-like domain-containing protein [Bdellovibrio bacteriovorus]AFY01910.1 serine protease spb1 [Bdellovibrio bacteriovorus str. Tiberius]